MGPDKIAEARATLARVAGALNRRNAVARVLPPLILLTDDQRDADYAEAIRALPLGSAIVIRHRNDAARRAMAQKLRDTALQVNVRFLIANDPALAADCDADGVHASEASLGLIPIWRKRNIRWLITGAIHATTPVEQIRDADALLLAPVFATPSHPRASPLGVEAFEAVARRLRLPVYALGGITSANVEQLAASHAAGIALIGGWLRS